jgi:hypothetical protein
VVLVGPRATHGRPEGPAIALGQAGERVSLLWRYEDAFITADAGEMPSGAAERVPPTLE